jgi:hypothetical protein
MRAADSGWRRLIDHLAVPGPADIDDLRVELRLRRQELNILRARWKGATGHLCSPQVATGAGHLYSSERIRWNQARPASDGRVGDAGQRGDPAHAL